MDNFKAIDMETWPRAEFYKLYTEIWTTQVYTLTKKLSVKKIVPFLKERGIKFVPAVIWLVSREVNRIENFRLAVKDGKLGEWNVIHPMFPTLNAYKNITFHSLDFQEDFKSFYEAYLEEQRENLSKTCLWATKVPENFFIVSVMPFLHFDASAMQLKNAKGYYAPFLAIGKYNEQMQLPCAITGNHAGHDAWHAAQLFDGIQKGFDNPDEWCKKTGDKG